MASLMAALIGIDWPVNSVGVLPDVDPTRPGYLLPKGGDETKAQAALVNAKVPTDVVSMFHVYIEKTFRLYSNNIGSNTVYLVRLL